MSHHKALSQWEQTVSTRLPHLSRPQAQVLAFWSYGMVLAQSCGITTVAALLADLTKTSLSTMRQRLREWCYDALRSLHGALHQCALSRLCHSGSLEADARWRERLMGALLEDLVQLSERQRAQRVDRDCAGRPWVVCALALPPHCDAGLASVLAHQSGRQGASGRGGEI